MRKHFARFKKIWNAYVKVAREVIGAGGTIAFEWPKNCAYWHWPRVKKFKKLARRLVRKTVLIDLVAAEFDCCAFGLTSGNGNPIRKPWRVATNMPVLFVALNARVQ